MLLLRAGGTGARRGLARSPGGIEIPHKWPGRARKGYRSTGPKPNRPVNPCFKGRRMGGAGPIVSWACPGGGRITGPLPRGFTSLHLSPERHVSL